jgi:hypothetical protein
VPKEVVSEKLDAVSSADMENPEKDSAPVDE